MNRGSGSLVRPSLTVAVVSALLSTGVQACETGPYFECTFRDGAKTVELCLNEKTLSYQFGPSNGKPELELERDVTVVELAPWPGIGWTIWEEITIRNKGYAYTIYASIDRTPPASGAGDIVVKRSGGISVKRGDEELAVLTCDPGSVVFPWSESLLEAKKAAGQCFEKASGQWGGC